MSFLRSRWYFKVRNDISVATLTRIIRALYGLKDAKACGIPYPVEGLAFYAPDILDMRIYPAYFEYHRENMELLLKALSEVVDMPRGALKIMEVIE